MMKNTELLDKNNSSFFHTNYLYLNNKSHGLSKYDEDHSTFIDGDLNSSGSIVLKDTDGNPSSFCIFWNINGRLLHITRVCLLNTVKLAQETIFLDDDLHSVLVVDDSKSSFSIVIADINCKLFLLNFFKSVSVVDSRCFSGLTRGFLGQVDLEKLELSHSGQSILNHIKLTYFNQDIFIVSHPQSHLVDIRMIRKPDSSFVLDTLQLVTKYNYNTYKLKNSIENNGTGFGLGMGFVGALRNLIAPEDYQDTTAPFTILSVSAISASLRQLNQPTDAYLLTAVCSDNVVRVFDLHNLSLVDQHSLYSLETDSIQDDSMSETSVSMPSSIVSAAITHSSLSVVGGVQEHSFLIHTSTAESTHITLSSLTISLSSPSTDSASSSLSFASSIVGVDSVSDIFTQSVVPRAVRTCSSVYLKQMVVLNNRVWCAYICSTYSLIRTISLPSRHLRDNASLHRSEDGLWNSVCVDADVHINSTLDTPLSPLSHTDLVEFYLSRIFSPHRLSLPSIMQVINSYRKELNRQLSPSPSPSPSHTPSPSSSSSSSFCVSLSAVESDDEDMCDNSVISDETIQHSSLLSYCKTKAQSMRRIVLCGDLALHSPLPSSESVSHNDITIDSLTTLQSFIVDTLHTYTLYRYASANPESTLDIDAIPHSLSIETWSVALKRMLAIQVPYSPLSSLLPTSLSSSPFTISPHAIGLISPISPQDNLTLNSCRVLSSPNTPAFNPSVLSELTSASPSVLSFISYCSQLNHELEDDVSDGNHSKSIISPSQATQALSQAASIINLAHSYTNALSSLSSSPSADSLKEDRYQAIQFHSNPNLLQLSNAQVIEYIKKSSGGKTSGNTTVILASLSELFHSSHSSTLYLTLQAISYLLSHSHSHSHYPSFTSPHFAPLSSHLDSLSTAMKYSVALDVVSLFSACSETALMEDLVVLDLFVDALIHSAREGYFNVHVSALPLVPSLRFKRTLSAFKSTDPRFADVSTFSASTSLSPDQYSLLHSHITNPTALSSSFPYIPYHSIGSTVTSSHTLSSSLALSQYNSSKPQRVSSIVPFFNTFNSEAANLCDTLVSLKIEHHILSVFLYLAQCLTSRTSHSLPLSTLSSKHLSQVNMKSIVAYVTDISSSVLTNSDVFHSAVCTSFSDCVDRDDEGVMGVGVARLLVSHLLRTPLISLPPVTLSIFQLLDLSVSSFTSLLTYYIQHVLSQTDALTHANSSLSYVSTSSTTVSLVVSQITQFMIETCRSTAALTRSLSQSQPSSKNKLSLRSLNGSEKRFKTDDSEESADLTGLISTHTVLLDSSITSLLSYVSGLRYSLSAYGDINLCIAKHVDSINAQAELQDYVSNTGLSTNLIHMCTILTDIADEESAQSGDQPNISKIVDSCYVYLCLLALSRENYSEAHSHITALSSSYIQTQLCAVFIMTITHKHLITYDTLSEKQKATIVSEILDFVWSPIDSNFCSAVTHLLTSISHCYHVSISASMSSVPLLSLFSSLLFVYYSNSNLHTDAARSAINVFYILEQSLLLPACVSTIKEALTSVYSDANSNFLSSTEENDFEIQPLSSSSVSTCLDLLSHIIDHLTAANNVITIASNAAHISFRRNNTVYHMSAVDISLTLQVYSTLHQLLHVVSKDHGVVSKDHGVVSKNVAGTTKTTLPSENDEEARNRDIYNAIQLIYFLCSASPPPSSPPPISTLNPTDRDMNSLLHELLTQLTTHSLHIPAISLVRNLLKFRSSIHNTLCYRGDKIVSDNQQLYLSASNHANIQNYLDSSSTSPSQPEVSYSKQGVWGGVGLHSVFLVKNPSTSALSKFAHRQNLIDIVLDLQLNDMHSLLSLFMDDWYLSKVSLNNPGYIYDSHSFPTHYFSDSSVLAPSKPAYSYNAPQWVKDKITPSDSTDLHSFLASLTPLSVSDETVSDSILQRCIIAANLLKTHNKYNSHSEYVPIPDWLKSFICPLEFFTTIINNVITETVDDNILSVNGIINATNTIISQLPLLISATLTNVSGNNNKNPHLLVVGVVFISQLLQSVVKLSTALCTLHSLSTTPVLKLDVLSTITKSFTSTLIDLEAKSVLDSPTSLTLNSTLDRLLAALLLLTQTTSPSSSLFTFAQSIASKRNIASDDISTILPETSVALAYTIRDDSLLSKNTQSNN